MDKPNIFNYATKELSQDAFIFWLLSWADPKYKHLNSDLTIVATQLLEQFFLVSGFNFPKSINNFKLKKQEANIDIVCYLNEYMIIVEDKTNTKVHSNQLIRYKHYAEEKEGGKYLNKVIAIFFKTFDQSNYKKEENDGFSIFTRAMFLKVIAKSEFQNIQSDIFQNYLSYILSIEEKVQSYKIKKIEGWSGLSWNGFFKELQCYIDGSNWGRVNNVSGGFMGFWWAFKENQFCTQYLQIEQDNLVLKISSNKANNSKKIREICYKHYLVKAKESELSFKKPTRFGKGKTMTILTTKYLIRDESSELINIESTLQELKKYTRFIETNFLEATQFVDYMKSASLSIPRN